MLNLSTMEWIRRACQEKLDREKRARELSEMQRAYLSQEGFEAYLRVALKNPEIVRLIVSAINNANAGEKR